MDKWIRALQTQADRARGGSGMGVITGLFPSMTAPGRRGKPKPLPTLEKELDRIVQRLNFLENEIILNTDDIHVRDKAPSLSAAETSADEPRGVAPPQRAHSLPLQSKFVPRRSEPPLAALLDFDSEDDPDSNNFSSNESSPAVVRHIAPLPVTKTHAWADC